KEQVAKIFSGEITDWAQVKSPGRPIKIFARDDKSGTFDSFKALVLGGAKLASGATRFEDSAALSDAFHREPTGMGFIGQHYVRDSKAVARSEGNALTLIPNTLTVSTEVYLLSRRLYLYTAPHSENAWVSKFIEFALSNEGQQIVAKNGFVAQTVNSQNAAVAQSAPTEYKRLTTGAERLS